MSGRLLIASNRLPVTIQEEQGKLRLIPSSGGLATAMRCPHEQSDGLWFGWPGEFPNAPAAEKRQLEAELRKMRTVPIPMTAKEVSSYYDAFSNGVLWPLLHYMIGKVRLDSERDFAIYQQINRRFAEAIAKEHRKGDIVWIHDYQLALVPGYLRELLPNATIGFFLHVPFPSAEVFRVLPWREEIVRGMLGADLVGFHTTGYRHNFAHAVALILGVDLGVDSITIDDRVIKIGVYPIGVDTAAFEEAVKSPGVAAEVDRLRGETRGKKLVLGIDRLDYTKGIPRRLLAIDRLLTREPSIRDKLHFLQVAVPTRQKVDHYTELRKQVNELVGRLNSYHGTPSGVPIHFLYRSIPFEQLTALYRAADVMLVTPLRDGMNLVAKEYVASRTDDRGVLVLSEMAGAADELREALTINPYHLTSVSSAILRAMEMGPEEQRLRMSAMRARVRRGDVHAWAARFMDDLRPSVTPVPIRVAGPMSKELADKARQAKNAKARCLLLDYDGTLVPFAPLPDLAAPDEPLRDLLRSLAGLPSTQVHILTGRTRESIGRWLGDLPIGIHAEHGFWTWRRSGWKPNHDMPAEWKPKVQQLFDDFVVRTPGSFVEEKAAALTLHYRGSDPTLVSERLPALRPRLVAATAGEPVELLDGAKVLEVRLTGVNKGTIARRLASDLPQGAVIMAAGDDRTDEDTFAALGDEAITIRVGSGRSRALYSVGSPQELRTVLSLLLG